MIEYSSYLKKFLTTFPGLDNEFPWSIIAAVQTLIQEKIKALPSDYKISKDIAIHQHAQIEENVTLKGPIIVSSGCFIGAHAYLRGGVYLGDKTVIGPGCEIKSSIIMSDSALAHFNFVGDSMLGSHVNMEAGSVIANHYNEREDKTIYVMLKKKIPISSTKFGAMVGDHSKIGANAVLSPGSILTQGSIVKRLELVEQCR
jgi:NDP-sugar pyrophosphorylase family protein